MDVCDYSAVLIIVLFDHCFVYHSLEMAKFA